MSGSGVLGGTPSLTATSEADSGRFAHEVGEASSTVPIFLHSSFRSGSTWLWSKLRRAPRTFCYYEVFNDILATISVDTARHNNHAAWDSRHPASAPYFLEFLPNIAESAGVAGFDPDMSYRDFIPPEGPNGPLRLATEAYIQRLIDTAVAMKRIPVVTCTRSLGRARAMRKAFGGHSIFLHRNLFHQWNSYWSLAEGGNTSFIDSVFRTISACRHDPFLNRVADWFGIESGAATSDSVFPVFLILHLYLYSIAFDASDLIIDFTGLAAGDADRGEVERRLSGLVGSRIDLSDLRQGCAFSTFTHACPASVRDSVELFVKLIPVSATSIEAAAFLHQAMEAAFSEWDRFEFYNRQVTTSLLARLDTAGKLLEERDAAISALEAKNAQMATELSNANRERDALKADALSAASAPDPVA